MLWSTKTKEGQEEVDFFLHFEAQSHPEEMAMRVFGYQVAIAQAFSHENRGKKVPIIMTFVLFHGKKKWKGARSIAEAYRDFKRQVLYGFETPFLIDLTQEADKIMKKDGRAYVAELALSSQANNNMLENMEKIFSQKMYDCCEKSLFFYYLLEYKEQKEKVFKELRKFAPDKAKKYENMIELIKQEGIQLGKQEGIQLVIKILKKKGLSQKEIKEILRETKKVKNP